MSYRSRQVTDFPKKKGTMITAQYKTQKQTYHSLSVEIFQQRCFIVHLTVQRYQIVMNGLFFHLQFINTVFQVIHSAHVQLAILLGLRNECRDEFLRIQVALFPQFDQFFRNVLHEGGRELFEQALVVVSLENIAVVWY